MQQTIYLADDEKNIRDLITSFLTREGFAVQAFPDGDALYLACRQQKPDLVILDIMMPGTDGLTICSQLRQESDLPIIILSAKDSPIDRVTGLTLGSDDYLIKPFLPLELVARVRALLRRTAGGSNAAPPASAELQFGTLCLSPALRTAVLDGKSLALTPTEFDFLAYLLEHRDRAVGRDELLCALWQFDWQADTRAADDLVKRLRRKLRERGCPVTIQTVWGFGFRLAEETPV